jgi:photosystem II stability/assembly factor-like uncharacterized protein
VNVRRPRAPLETSRSDAMRPRSCWAVALTLLAGLVLAACSSSSPAPTAAQKNAVAGILGTTPTTVAPLTPVSTVTPPSTALSASASTTPTTGAIGGGSTPSPSAWQATGTTALPLYAISCMTPSICIAVGGASGQGAAYSTGNGGSTWADLLLPAGTPILEGVSCPSSSECVAVGGALILVTSNAGATWTADAESGDIRAVSCPDTVHCVAVGAGVSSKGASYSSSNGGTSWAMTAISTATPNAVACPSDLSCHAAGEASDGGSNNSAVVLATSDQGASWSTQYATSGTTSVYNGASCWSDTSCEVVGQANQQPVLGTTDGQTWTHQPVGDSIGARSWNDVDCTTTFCIAVGNAAPIMLQNVAGARWKFQALPAGAGSMSSVACAGTTCIAAGFAQDGTSGFTMAWR